MGGRLELPGADPPPEDVVGPGLVDEHERQEEEDDDGHRFERGPAGGGGVHGEVIGGVGGGGPPDGGSVGDDCDGPPRPRYRGRGADEAVSAPLNVSSG